MDPFYVVLRDHPQRCPHSEDEAAALEDARRRARETGQRFVVLKCIAVAEGQEPEVAYVDQPAAAMGLDDVR